MTKKIVDLDRLDRKLLFELDQNSSVSLSQLARQMKQGRDRVEYRVQRLIEEGVIKNFVTTVNLYRLGLTVYKTFFRIEHQADKYVEFYNYLKNHPRIYRVVLCDGAWDLMIALYAYTPAEFYQIHSEILSKYNKFVIGFATYTLANVAYYSRAYLIKPVSNEKLERVVMHLGGAVGRGQVAIDDIDLTILNELGANSRCALNYLASKVHLSVEAVNRRIAALESSKVITGYRVELNLSRIGLSLFKTQLYLNDYSSLARRKLLSFCETFPQITSYIEQIGDCNIEIETEVADYAEYTKFIDTLRNEFPSMVRNHQTLMFRDFDRYPVPGAANLLSMAAALRSLR